MSEFLMPSLGADMDTATVVEWMVKPGDSVHKGDIIAAVETSKGIMDIEIFEDAIISEILVSVDEEVSVGTALAILQTETETEEEASSRPPPNSPEPSKPEIEKTPSGSVPTKAEAPRTTQISPAARQKAKALQVNIDRIHGTGPKGAITVKDVKNAATKTDHQMMRQTIAAAMTRSKQEIPHYYLSSTIDLTDTLTWLARGNTERPITERLVYAVLLIKAVAGALAKVPELNGFWIDDAFKPSSSINIGMAISIRQGGLVAPALHDVQDKNIDLLMAEFRDLVTRARRGRIRQSEFITPSITVSSIGEQGVETIYSIIYPPQVAIVSFGAIIERPWSVNGRIESRQLIKVSLSADHRASDGHRGALFLNTLSNLLQNPEKL